MDATRDALRRVSRWQQGIASQSVWPVWQALLRCLIYERSNRSSVAAIQQWTNEGRWPPLSVAIPRFTEDLLRCCDGIPNRELRTEAAQRIILPALTQNSDQLLGDIFESFLQPTTKSGRRVGGSHYTPADLARQICKDALVEHLCQLTEVASFPDGRHRVMQFVGGDPNADPWDTSERRQLSTLLQSIKIIDPAVGAGVFLLEFQTLITRLLKALGIDEHNVISQLHGIDLNADAVRVCQTRLWLASPNHRHSVFTQLNNQIVCQDALSESKWPCMVADIVIGNPPYLSARHLLQEHGKAYKTELRSRFQTARGAYDLYALFWEQSLRNLQQGSVASLIVPNKILTADYARPLRAMLARQTVLRLRSFAASKCFRSAAVYPVAITMTQNDPSSDACVQVSGTDLGEPNTIQQRQLCPTAGGVWSLASPTRSTSRSVPLGQLAKVHAGITGFSAKRLLNVLSDTPVDDQTIPFIVTRNIDPFRVQHGPLRYMKHSFEHPFLKPDQQFVSAGKIALFRQEKIVIGGMGRKLEAAYAPQPLAVGVQVFCLTDWQIDPFFLLGMLNSHSMSSWYRATYAGKRLAGGYYSVNKGQLAELPIPRPGASTEAEIANLASMLTACAGKSERLQQALDDLVASLEGTSNQACAA